MESLKVKDYMNKRPVTFDEKMTVAEAVEKLLKSGQSGGPVVAQNNKVVGFLSERDCIEKMIVSSYYRERVADVSEIMKTEVMSVKTYHSILEVAEKMTTEKPKVYPVLDDDGCLVGTISRADVLTAIDVQLNDGYSKHD